MEKLLTINEVCERLNVSRATYYRWSESDLDFPPAVCLGPHSKRYRQEDILRYEGLKSGNPSSNYTYH